MYEKIGYIFSYHIAELRMKNEYAKINENYFSMIGRQYNNAVI